MNDDDIRRDRETIRQASEGPWRTLDDAVMTTDQEGCFAHMVADLANCDNRSENLDFFVEARTRWPAALDEIERLREENAALRQQVVGHCERIAHQSELLSRRAEKGGST